MGDAIQPSVRADNAIDFWRGVALVMIFINHIPGNVFASYTLRNFAISDAAEIFVLLAGSSMSFLAGAPQARKPLGVVVLRLLRRTFQIYRAQLLVTVFALALLAAAALVRDNPLFLEWHDAGAAFNDTPRAMVGLVLLSYQIGYFNILPMYVVLLLMAPAFLALAHISRAAAFAASVGLYLVVLVTHTSLPYWPTSGSWFFNPLAWQLLFMIGFTSADWLREDPSRIETVRRLSPWAAGLCLVGTALTVYEFRPDPLAVPEPRLLFLFDKQFLSPVRVLSVLALAIAFFPVFGLVRDRLGGITRYLCRLGRNSLAVFAMGSLLALAGQVVRFVTDGSLPIDIAVVSFGLLVMGLVAWGGEFMQRAQQSPPRS